MSKNTIQNNPNNDVSDEEIISHFKLLRDLWFSGVFADIANLDVSENGDGVVHHLVGSILSVPAKRWHRGEYNSRISQGMLADLEGCCRDTVRRRQRVIEKLGFAYRCFDERGKSLSNHRIDLAPIFNALEKIKAEKQSRNIPQVSVPVSKGITVSNTQPYEDISEGEVACLQHLPDDISASPSNNQGTHNTATSYSLNLKRCKSTRLSNLIPKTNEIACERLGEIDAVIRREHVETGNFTSDQMKATFNNIAGNLGIKYEIRQDALARHEVMDCLAIVVLARNKAGVENPTGFAIGLIYKKRKNLWKSIDYILNGGANHG